MARDEALKAQELLSKMFPPGSAGHATRMRLQTGDPSALPVCTSIFPHPPHVYATETGSLTCGGVTLPPPAEALPPEVQAIVESARKFAAEHGGTIEVDYQPASQKLALIRELIEEAQAQVLSAQKKLAAARRQVRELESSIIRPLDPPSSKAEE